MRDENARRSKVFMINLFFELDFSPLELLITNFLFVFSPLFLSLSTHLCKKLSLSKTLVKKWFNIKSKAQDFHADQDVFSRGFSLFHSHSLKGFLTNDQAEFVLVIYFRRLPCS